MSHKWKQTYAERDFKSEEQSRYVQLERVLRTAEAIKDWRYGGTVDEINLIVNQRTGMKYSTRTTVRDLKFLESFGVVYRDATHGIWKHRNQKSIFELPVDDLNKGRLANAG